MKNLLVLIIGVVVGAGGMYFYNQSVTLPAATLQAETATKQMLAQEQQMTEKFFTGVITAQKDDQTITVTLDQSIDASEALAQRTITVTLDQNTRYLRPDAASLDGLATMTRKDLANNARVTVVSNEPIGDKTTVYAQEIVQF